MPKKCKDCDPNKYIEGIAWRGKNGISYDGYTIYNDVGKPLASDSTLADVNDLVDAYNPIFSQSTTYPNPLPESPTNGVEITGIDRGQGFWFVWSFINGLVMYGTPGVGVNAASIISSGTASARLGQGFSFNVLLDQVASYLTYTDFGVLADTNTDDRLRFSNTNSNTIPFIKTKINYVGYYTGIIQSVLNGNRYVKINNVTQLETFKAYKSLTIKCTDAEGNDPIYVTSAPTIHVFKNQSFSYSLTTNLASNKFNAYLDQSSLNILANLGLAWNPSSKTITGVGSTNLSSEIKNTNLNFTIYGPNADAGNRISFSLNLLYGAQNTQTVLPTVSATTFNRVVGTKFEQGLAGLNNKHTIIGISSLPEGLVFNSTSKSITGTPKHAGTFYAYASCSNARGSSSKVTLTFNFSPYSLNNDKSQSTFPSKINLPSWDFNAIKNNKIVLDLYTTGDDIIYFKKINTNEFETIRKNGEPNNITSTGGRISTTSFSPGQGQEGETCFWIKIDDPTKTNVKNPELDISIKGNYAIQYYSTNQKDLVGNVCYTPDANASGPASTPFIQNLTVTATDTIKTAFSANPAENMPTITVSPTQVEHQVVFDLGNLGVGVTPNFSTVTIVKQRLSGREVVTVTPGSQYRSTIENSSIFARQRLSKSGLLKYPNGIPASEGTYTFYVILADTCTFNKSTQRFSLYINTYTPRAGDVYSCKYRSTCFPAGTKIHTPHGDKNIEDLKENQEVYGYDEDQNLEICKISQIFDEGKDPQPITKVTLEDGSTIRCTKSHPFLTENNEYKFLIDLNIGDYLMTFNKKKLKIINIENDGFELVYNFEVEKYHNYIADKIFVHNRGGGGRRKDNKEYYQDYTLPNSTVPSNCVKVVSRAGDRQQVDNYGYRYANKLKDTKDIGITSLTNISLLDILGEGPIEGIVDYDIVPNDGAQIGDIGYKNGVKIVKYEGPASIVRSIYWNEIPVADNTYPVKGSLNFEFIKLAYDYGDGAPRHTVIEELKNIKLEESFYARKVNNGQYIQSLVLKNDTTGQTLANEIKLPRRLTSTKVVGNKLFGKRKFQDGSSKTYKKSLTILTKDLYGLRLHLKALSLFKSVVDMTIWDSADQASKNAVSGRTDRLEMTFYLYLKRIDYIPNVGKQVTIIPNPDYTGVSNGTFTISEEAYYNNIYSKQNDVLILFWPPDCPNPNNSNPNCNGPDGYKRQPANYTEFINGRTTYSHRHDGAIYTVYALDVNRLQKDFRTSLQDYINKQQSSLDGEARDYGKLTIAGKLNQGPYIETFEWTGLDRYTKSTTVGWEIEIEPVYEESVDPNIVIKSSIDSITEIYDDLLVLPHTAGVLTTFDSRYFTSIPQRAYDTRLLKVKIPSNYNPYSRTYNGIWDGNFNLGWTDNPAWCFYDLITNRRYGLGKYVDPNLTDKWTLYEIAQYCDQLVSSGGSGDGKEPRFTCNVLISTREDAYKVVNDMASIFRAIVFYNAGLIFTSQDRPKEPIYIFNNSNVKDGEFTYSNTSKRVRRNVALVRYNDKNNFYKPAVKYVESREGLIRFGIKEMEVSAFGCTSEGQAERLGKWTLLSENLESELVNFETSLPAMYLKPGDIVYIQDQNRQNKILGGRTYEVSRNYAILDVKYEDISGFLPAINSCNFNILTPAGNIEIGTETGNAIVKLTSENKLFSVVGDNGQRILSSGLSTSLIRKKQIQTVKFESNYTIQDPMDTNIFSNNISMQNTGNFQGYTRIDFGGQYLDNTEHTLMQNTVWTIEINPENYDYNKSPSVSGFSNPGVKYPGASLEPYMDKTQKFRILDIEEQEEYRYKITALQYDESKYDLGDNI